MGAELSDSELDYFRNKHKSIIVRMVDSFMFLTDRALNLTRMSGILGMILPDVILYQIDNFKLRNRLLNETALSQHHQSG